MAGKLSPAGRASAQTLTDAQRRTLARWAVVCAERVLPLWEAEMPTDDRVPRALARARAYSRGQGTAAEEIRHRLLAVKAAGDAVSPAGAAAARAVAQAAAVAHMGAHALGAAAYAVKAVSLANPGDPAVVEEEIAWQAAQLTDADRAALRLLPALGEDSAGPLGPGRLSRGTLGDAIRKIQSDINL